MIVEALPFQSHLTVSNIAVSEPAVRPQPREQLATSDRIDISASNLGKPTIRTELVRRIREQVATGGYLNRSKLDAAADRLRAVLASPDSLS